MKRIIISAALLLLIPGCLKVGPDFSPPQVATQSHWRNNAEGQITTRDEQLNQWWKLLNDPHLDSLIAMAARQNLSLKAAAMRVIEARALLGIAVGDFFPQTQEAVGDAVRQKTSKNTPNSRTSDRKYWDFQLGLTAAWELDFWGKFRRAIESAGQELCAEQADFDDVLVILLSDVASTYVAIRTLEERIDIVKQNIAIQERSLEIAQARWEAGMVTELDVKQAETLVSSTEARLPELTADLQSGENALAVLLGIPPLDIDCFLHSAGKIPVPPHDIAASIPCALLHRRPDIRRAYHETASQSARIGIAVSDLLPAISITGFFGLETNAGASRRTTAGNRKLFSSDSLTYNYGGGFSWPLLNYGRLLNRVKAEKALFGQALYNYRNTVLVAYQEVEDNLVSFFQTQTQISYLEESEKAAMRSTELARTQYVEGVDDYTRVLNTEQALIEQQEDLAISRGKLVQSLIASYRALGGGWKAFVCN